MDLSGNRSFICGLIHRGSAQRLADWEVLEGHDMMSLPGMVPTGAVAVISVYHA